MMMRRRAILPLALLAMQATPALAHPGHEGASGLAAGLLHPLTGADHFLVMLMVGAWAGLAFPRRVWACPAAFLVAMLAGFAWGVAGGGFPYAEALILGSLLGLGAALLFEARPPLALAVGMAALFAAGHGYAHGAEMPTGGDPLRFAVGFTIMTAMLHLLGLGMARAAGGRSRLPGRILGGSAAILSLTLAWAS